MDKQASVNYLVPPEREALIQQMHQKNNFARLLNIEIISLAEGSCRLELAAGDNCANPYGGVHGGATATLADIAMGIAVRTLGLQPVTVELTVNYLGPGQAGDVLICDGRIIHRGRRLLLAESEVRSENGGSVLARGRAIFTTRRERGTL